MTSSIEALLPAFLAGQRWYGDKASPIESVGIVDSADVGGIQHLIVEVRSSAGATSEYYVPLISNDLGEIADAVHAPAYHDWIASNGRNPTIVEMDHGHLLWEITKIEGRESLAIHGPARVLGVEQSNTSVRFGDEAIVKILRRLQPGVNPEIELTQFLTERTSFKNSPALLGTLTYAPANGDEVALAVAQAFVPSISDGWTAVLASLADFRAAGSDERTVIAAESHDLTRQLGRRTAELHLALASDPSSAALAPESISDPDVNLWRMGFAARLDRVSASLERYIATDSQTEDLRRVFLESKSGLVEGIAGFECLRNVAKTRVHGDYHLGQTLLTHDRDWFVLDFEGEPLRPLNDRRAKTSPLKDVAGMLRSFSYARGAAERAGDPSNDVAGLINWERGERSAFLDGSLSNARAGGAGFLPTSSEEVRLAIGAWELDKAVYEIDYELNNRPDWLHLPLSAALKFV